MTPAARREAVQETQERFLVSERRACGLIGIRRSSFKYHTRRPDDGPLRAALCQAAAERKRGWLAPLDLDPEAAWMAG